MLFPNVLYIVCILSEINYDINKIKIAVVLKVC